MNKIELFELSAATARELQSLKPLPDSVTRVITEAAMSGKKCVRLSYMFMHYSRDERKEIIRQLVKLGYGVISNETEKLVTTWVFWDIPFGFIDGPEAGTDWCFGYNKKDYEEGD